MITSLLLERFTTVLVFSIWVCWQNKLVMRGNEYVLVCNEYVTVHTKHEQVYTSTYLRSLLSELPHSTFSQTLCRILCAFSKFHFPFLPVLSVRFWCRRSSRSTTFWCRSGSSDSGMQGWQVAKFQSMYCISTSVTSLLGSETGCKPWRREPALAFLMAALMSST